mmetsp:Transcript_6050/g.19429  ORF Transcript_6050/g.19429 Transcript_6050/m.19429 type:complete len:280 (+) Transcript_6050:746-1585(+)
MMEALHVQSSREEAEEEAVRSQVYRCGRLPFCPAFVLVLLPHHALLLQVGTLCDDDEPEGGNAVRQEYPPETIEWPLHIHGEHDKGHRHQELEKDVATASGHKVLQVLALVVPLLARDCVQLPAEEVHGNNDEKVAYRRWQNEEYCQPLEPVLRGPLREPGGPAHGQEVVQVHVVLVVRVDVVLDHMLKIPARRREEHGHPSVGCKRVDPRPLGDGKVGAVVGQVARQEPANRREEHDGHGAALQEPVRLVNLETDQQHHHAPNPRLHLGRPSLEVRLQ